MKPRQWDFNPHYSYNPTFLYYQLGVTLAVASKLGVISLGHDKNYFLAHPDVYGRFYLVARLLCVAYGIATTILLFFIGRRVTSSDVGGLWTALLYAVVPMSAIQCHVMDTSVSASFWLGLSFLGLMRACESPDNKWFYIGAFAAGLSLSTKYTGAPLVLLMIYTAWQRGHLWKGTLIAFVIAGIGYAIGTPYMILDAANMLQGLLGMSRSAAGTYLAPNLHTYAYALVPYGYAVGTVLSLLAVVGLAGQARHRKPAAILALLFLVPYLFLLMRSTVHIARYVNETLPFFLPFTACPLLILLENKSGIARMAAAVLALLCLSQAPYTLAIDRSLASDIDPRDQASEWITNNASGKRIGLEQEANFMMPAHLYMDYWKGIRYPDAFVLAPHYAYSRWDPDTMRWDPAAPDDWIKTNLFFSGVYKNKEQKDSGGFPIGYANRIPTGNQF